MTIPSDIDSTNPIFTIKRIEGEAIEIHRNGEYWKTFYAHCPEEAEEFARAGLVPMKGFDKS